MSDHPIFGMEFAKLYPCHVDKAERKGRTKEEVDEIICWLTGYDQDGLEEQINVGAGVEAFFEGAPAFNPACPTMWWWTAREFGRGSGFAKRFLRRLVWRIWLRGCEGRGVGRFGREGPALPV